MTLSSESSKLCSVLLDFKWSKREIRYAESQDLIQLCEAELQSLVGKESGRYRKSAEEKPHLLQHYSTEWQEFVHVIDTIEIDDKDHLKAVPLLLASPVKVHEFNGHFCKLCYVFP